MSRIQKGVRENEHNIHTHLTISDDKTDTYTNTRAKEELEKFWKIQK